MNSSNSKRSATTSPPVTQLSLPLEKLTPQLWQPRDYMMTGVKFLLEHGAAGLILDPGLGKTSITLAFICELKRLKILEPVLLVAPLRVCYEVWPIERDKWKQFNHLSISVIHGPHKLEKLNESSDIHCINPEGLLWLLNSPEAAKALKRFKILIIDESTKFKASSTQRFKLLKNILGQFRRRIILTGTPSPNGLMDLFGQIYILDLGNSLGRYITHYKNNFFYPTGYGGYTWLIQPDKEKQIYKNIAPLIMRISEKDRLKLPKKITNIIKVGLPKKAIELYRGMEEEFFVQIKSKVVTAASGAVSGGKCRQIANGGLYTNDLRSGKLFKDCWLKIHDEKTNAVEDLVEQLQGNPLLVLYEFEHDLARLKERFKSAPHLGGGVNPKEVHRIITAWNKGELPLLLAQPATVYHGLNMQGCSQHICFHSIGWNLEHDDQTIRRIVRSGNPHDKVFIHRIIAKDTLDEVVLAVLDQKDKTQRTLLTALERYCKRREKL